MVILNSKKIQVKYKFQKGHHHDHFIHKKKFKSSLNFKKGTNMVILYSKKFQVESEFQKGHQHGHFIIKKKYSQV